MAIRNRNNWNLETMNKYCNEQNINYKVLETKHIDKSYQKQQWALVKCPNENHEPYWVWWNNFRNGDRCKLCHYENNNIIEWDKNKIIDFYNSYELKVVNPNNWHSVDIPIEVEDTIGFKYMTSITTIRKIKRKSNFIFHKLNPFSLYNLKLYCKLYRPDYELISDKYIDIKTNYIWKYNGNMLPITEDRLFELLADSFVNGDSGHPYFSKSKGVVMFEELLILNNINYEREKTFEGCKDKKLLRFDFYLLDFNENIEIDGIQHNTIVKLWDGEEGLKIRIKRDKIKNKHCEDNNIKLTRIPYDHKNKNNFKKLIDVKIDEIINYNKVI